MQKTTFFLDTKAGIVASNIIHKQGWEKCPENEKICFSALVKVSHSHPHIYL
jgi:hypothetical protein